MANQPIASSDLDSAGMEMTYIAAQFVKAGRNYNTPLKYFTDVSADVGEMGKAVNVPIAASVTSALLTDGNPVVLDNTAMTTQAVTLNKHRYHAFARTSVAEAIAGNYSAKISLQSSIAALLNGFEADCLSAITSGLTTNTQGTYNTALTADVVDTAIASLDAAKAPEAPRIGFLRHDSNAYPSFIKVDRVAQWSFTGVESPFVQANPNIRPYNGVLWHKTQALPKSVNNIDNCILCPGSIAVAVRMFPEPNTPAALVQNVVDEESGIGFQIVYQWDTSTLSNQYIVRMLYGFSVLNEKYGALVKS